MSPDQAGDLNDPSFRVVVFATPDDPYALRDILMRALSLNAVDAQIHAHTVPGVLPDRMTQAQATGLVEAIQAIGVNASVFADDNIPSLDQATQLHHVRCLQKGLEVLGLTGEREELLEWADLELISIGNVPLESARHYEVQRSTVASSGPHFQHSAIDIPALTGAEVWLIGKNPYGVYRIDHTRMNYEYLGDSKSESSTANFRLMMDDLVGYASDAYLTPSTHAFINHGLLRQYAFDSPEELQRYTTFHLLLLRRMRGQ